MGQHTDRARDALLDAAEELFAQHGIDAVSNRRIAEHAGSANHSAVGYHFGARDDLLRALVLRHNEPMVQRRREMLAQLDAEPTVHDVLACRLLPFVEMLDSLPRPSWRARFLAQIGSVPSGVGALRDVIDEIEVADDAAVMKAALPDVPLGVLRGRSAILGSMVLGVCAEQEKQVDAGTNQGTWTDVGYFLVDASAGMLSAPVTKRPSVPDVTRLPRLI